MENNVFDLCYDEEIYLNCDCSLCPYYLNGNCRNPNEKYIDEEEDI